MMAFIRKAMILLPGGGFEQEAGGEKFRDIDGT
jgi:hypothetical protein